MAQVIGQADRPHRRTRQGDGHGGLCRRQPGRAAWRSAPSWGPPSPVGAIAAIDANAARRMPGVLLVMTHENAPKQAPFQAKADDRHARPKPQLASDKVQYFGQPVALVVAETAEAARAAASAIVVTYEKANGAFVLESASGPRTTPARVRPAHRPTARSATSTRRSPPRP